MDRYMSENNEMRVYMAGLSLTEFIGFSDVDEYCRNTVFQKVDVDSGKLLIHDDPREKELVLRAAAAGESWDEVVRRGIDAYVAPEHKPQTERFFSRRHMRNVYERGGRTASLEFSCVFGEEPIWNRATILLAEEEGSLIAMVILIDISRSRNRELTLTNMATRDGLTGLLNRVTAQDLINESLANSPEGPAAVAVIDIDNFKQTNDRYGHEHGDRILLNFSDEMQEYFDNDVLISRTGGDEFLLYLPSRTKEEAEEILAGFAEKDHFGFRDGDEEFRFYASVGYAMYPEQGKDYESLTALADEAMYAAKVNRYTHHMIHSEEAMPEHRTGLGFSLRELTASVPAAMLIYRAGPGEEILFANDELIRFFDCEDYDDFMEFTDGSFSNVVHPDDIDRVEAEIRAQIENEASDNYDYCRYRIRTRSGRIKDIEDYGRLVRTDHFGEVFYVILHDEAQRDALVAMTK